MLSFRPLVEKGESSCFLMHLMELTGVILRDLVQGGFPCAETGQRQLDFPHYAYLTPQLQARCLSK